MSGLKLGRRPNTSVDTFAAHELYKELGTLEEVSKKLGCPTQTLSYRFKKEGLQVFSRGGRRKYEDVENYDKVRYQKNYQRRKMKKQGMPAEIF